jgi:hypothetical protein
MAHLHRQAEAGAPVRPVTGDGRSRYPRTVIATESPRTARHHDITRPGETSTPAKDRSTGRADNLWHQTIAERAGRGEG